MGMVFGLIEPHPFDERNCDRPARPDDLDQQRKRQRMIGRRSRSGS